MDNHIISVQNLSFIYPGAESPTLKSIDLEIGQGEFTAIVGGNGSGKTTLCKAFNGLIPHYHAGDYEGTVAVKGVNTLETTVASLARDIAYVYQDYENQLVCSTVFEDVCFAPLNYGIPDFKARGEWALELLGIGSLAQNFIWELSGGQKHLVALAGALSLDPEIIIIDEPAAQLDPQNAVLIYEKLRQLNEDLHKTILVIEHHTELIGSYCRQVILMEQGTVLWKEPVRQALNRVDELMGKNIYPPQVTQVASKLHRLHPGRKFTGMYPVTIEQCPAYFSGFTSQQPESPGGTEPRGKFFTPAIVFEGVSQGYKTLQESTKTALDNLNVTLYEGERVAIVGSNGAGKSTMLRMISGLTRPMEGIVNVLGQDTREVLPEELAEKVTYIYQNPEQMFIEDSIRGDIEYFLKVRRHPEREAFIEQIISRFHLEDIQHRDGRTLSGGQQRRASLAIGIAMKPSIILLDEPTASLDIASRKEMIAMLEILKETVRTVVVATHDMQLVAEWAQRVLVMDHGKMIADGKKGQVFENPGLLHRASLKPPQTVEFSSRIGMIPAALSVDECVSRLLIQEGV